MVDTTSKSYVFRAKQLIQSAQTRLQRIERPADESSVLKDLIAATSELAKAVDRLAQRD